MRPSAPTGLAPPACDCGSPREAWGPGRRVWSSNEWGERRALPPATGGPGEWSGHAYAEHSGHHRAFDDWFLKRHPPSSSDIVVDLGCGSGEFSAKVATLVPDGRVIGVDPDTSMLEQARAHDHPNLAFVEAAADDIDQILPEGSADLVVSRAMLHWLPLSRYPHCFEAVHRVLKPGGWYHSESAGAGNLQTLSEIVEEIAAAHGIVAPPRFPDVGVVFELLEAAAFELPQEAVRSVAQRRAFSRERLTSFLRSQAAVALTGGAPEELQPALIEALVGAAERLRRHDGTFDQTFVRLEILARKPI